MAQLLRIFAKGVPLTEVDLLGLVTTKLLSGTQFVKTPFLLISPVSHIRGIIYADMQSTYRVFQDDRLGSRFSSNQVSLSLKSRILYRQYGRQQQSDWSQYSFALRKQSKLPSTR